MNVAKSALGSLLQDSNSSSSRIGSSMSIADEYPEEAAILEPARLLLIEGVFRHQSRGSQPKPAWVSVAGKPVISLP
jgi:hypothetical protein